MRIRRIVPPPAEWPRSGRRVARLGMLLALAFAVGISVRCTRELDPARGSGGVALTWKAEPGAPVARADSARTWVLDGRDRILVGPVAAPLDSAAGSFDIALVVPAGDDRVVRMQLEGPGARGRGVVAEGEARGITVPAAGTAEAHVRLHDAVPRLAPFTGQPGDLRITVRWSSVLGATGYRLYRLPSPGPEQIEEVADTVRVFELTDLARWSRRSAGAGSPPAGLRGPAALDTTWFRVSAHLRGGALSVASDPLAVSFSWVEDTPHVLTVAPADGAVGVPDSAAVEITFDRPMDPSSLGDLSVPSADDHVNLRVNGTAEFVVFAPDSTVWRDGGRRLRLRPAAPLHRDAGYLLNVTSGLRDLDGRPLDQSRPEAGLQGFESRFGTEHYDPLRVTAVTPENGAVGVALRPVLQAWLNRKARAASVNAGTVLLADSAGAPVECSVALLQDSVIRVTPAAALRFARRYVLTVTTGVRDLRGRDGEPLDQDSSTPAPDAFVTAFRTLPQPTGPWVTGCDPPANAGSVPITQVVRVRFSRPVQVASVGPEDITVRRLPVGSALPGLFAPSPDRKEFVFTTTQFERGVSYRLIVKAGGLDAQGNPVGIRDDLGIPFDQDSTAAGYQDFTSLFRVENNPQVASMAPAPRRTNVPVDTLVTLRFSLPIARNSVTAANLALLEGTLPLPMRPLEWSADSMQVTLRPLHSYSFCDTFTVFVDTSLLSTRGSRFDQEPGQAGYQPFDAWFITGADGIPPRVATCIPGPDSVNVPIETAVTVRFTKPVIPSTAVSAASFFMQKLPPGGPPGPELAATRTMTPDSLEATLRPAVPLENDAEYQVTVKKWVQDRCGQQLDQDPGTPYNQDFTSTFRTAIERVPPSVVSVAPGLGEVDVPVDATVEVTFTEPMGVEGTLTGAFSLSGPGGPVAGQSVLSLDRTRLVFTPAAPLRNAVRFDVEVDTTATDLAGNHFDQYPGTGPRHPFTSFFTTAPDRIPPHVLSSAPADGDTAVEVTVQPLVTFSESMAPSTLEGALRLLDPEGTPVPLARVTVAADHRSAIVVPADSLRFSTLYTLEAGTAAMDTSGNGLDQEPATPGAQPYFATFRTRADNIPPRVRGLLFDGGPPVPIASRLRVAFDEAVDPVTVTGQTVRLLLDGDPVESAVSPLAPDTALVVPVAPLDHDTTYTVEVAGVADLHGNLLDQDRAQPGNQPFIAAFRTVKDTVSPRVISVFPSADSTGVDPGIEVEVRFSEPVNAATVAAPAFAVYNTAGGGVLPGMISPSPGDTLFRFHPAARLARGASFLVRVTTDVRDRAGNHLDQDPGTPILDPFESTFVTGTPPRASAGPGVCDPSDTSITLDASASSDSAGTVTRAEIDWGDGDMEAIDLLEGPVGSWPTPTHTYACMDDRGCNLVDDDGDGVTDETGAGGCDESYRIILRVRNSAGLWAADTAGVAFCDLQVLSSVPAAGAADVDTLISAIRLRFTRAIVPHPSLFRLETEAGDSVNVQRSWDDGGLTAVLTPLGGPLQAGATYRIRALAGIQSVDGRSFDQLPCTAGVQPFEAVFHTLARPSARAPIGPPRPMRSPSGSSAQERRPRGR